MDNLVRILLVEDDPAYAAFLGDLLAYDDCDLTSVETLQRALAALTRTAIDCVLLDLTLPDARGLSALCQLIEHAPEAPIVVVTGFDDDHLALAAINEGAHEYLAKAEIGPRRLRRSIAQAIQRKRTAIELRRARGATG